MPPDLVGGEGAVVHGQFIQTPLKGTDLVDIRGRAPPLEPPDQKARGVIGVGEPPTISTAAAIANAVTNAIGVRVPEWPMTPRNVLNALATASKEGKA